MLLELRNYMRRERLVSLQQLARAFGAEASALEPMLDLLVKKGAVKTLNEKVFCQKACSGCKTNWVYECVE